MTRYLKSLLICSAFWFTSVEAEVVVKESFYPEGPLVVDVGNADSPRPRLYFVEYSTHRIRSFDMKTKHLRTVWERSGCGPASLKWRVRQETLMVSCYDENTIVELKFGDNQFTTHRTYREGSTGGKWVGPNDFVADRRGGVYFSASGVFDRTQESEGTLWYLDSTGTITRVAGNLRYPNGLALLQNGRRLVVSEHFENRLITFDLEDNPLILANRSVFADFNSIPGLQSVEAPHPHLGPDGLASDNEETVWVAHYGGARVIRIKLESSAHRPPAPKLQTKIVPIPLPYVTNVAIHRGTLVVTSVSEEQAPFRGSIFQLPSSD